MVCRGPRNPLGVAISPQSLPGEGFPRIFPKSENPVGPPGPLGGLPIVPLWAIGLYNSRSTHPRGPVLVPGSLKGAGSRDCFTASAALQGLKSLPCLWSQKNDSSGTPNRAKGPQRAIAAHKGTIVNPPRGTGGPRGFSDLGKIPVKPSPGRVWGEIGTPKWFLGTIETIPLATNVGKARGGSIPPQSYVFRAPF